MPFEFGPSLPIDSPAAIRREELWLLGQPPLNDYLDFVCRNAGGETRRRDEIIAEWRHANEHLAKLEVTEAGLADRIRCRKLPGKMLPLAENLRQQDLFRNTIDRVPTTIEMVELDRIVVSQRHVTLPFVRKLAAGLEARPKAADLFRFCQPLDRRDAAVECHRLGRNRYAFLWQCILDPLHALRGGEPA